MANRSHGHEEVNGVRLYGLDAEMHRKMESKRDRELEKQLAQWVLSPPSQTRLPLFLIFPPLLDAGGRSDQGGGGPCRPHRVLSFGHYFVQVRAPSFI